MRIEECGKHRTEHSFSNDLALLLVTYWRIVNILGTRIYHLSPMKRTCIFQKNVWKKKELELHANYMPLWWKRKVRSAITSREYSDTGTGVRDTGSRITVHNDCNDGAVLNANSRYRVSATQPYWRIVASICVNVIDVPACNYHRSLLISGIQSGGLHPRSKHIRFCLRLLLNWYYKINVRLILLNTSLSYTYMSSRNSFKFKEHSSHRYFVAIYD